MSDHYEPEMADPGDGDMFGAFEAAVARSVHAYCVRCGYMFITTPGLPPIPCRCGQMLRHAE
jgi:hypothetical protein